MPLDPFADALNDDLDDDLDSDATLIMNGAAPSLDASDEHSVIDIDDLSEEDGHTAKLEVSSLPAAGIGEPAAVTQTKNKAASATQGKRKLSSSKASGPQPIGAKKAKRGINPDTAFKLTIVNQTNGADIKCVFIPRLKGEQEAIPLLPQFGAKWRDVDFVQRTWLVISTQSRWVQVLMKAQLRTNPSLSDSRKACAHLYALVKSEFDTCLHKQRCLTRAKSLLDKEKIESKNRELESSDESSAENEDDSQGTFAEKTQELERQQFRVGRGLTPCMQVDIGGYPVMCINSKKRCVVAVDTQVVSFISNWLTPLAQESARILALDKSGKDMDKSYRLRQVPPRNKRTARLPMRPVVLHSPKI